MIGEKDDVVDVEEEKPVEDSFAETVILTEVDEEPVGDSSVELNVEKLVAKIEATDEEEVHRKAEIRHKLEELQEQQDKEQDSTYNFNLDEDV